MRTVQLYVNDQRVDLFKDEEIQITSSIQNISDISKVFTDFTQTFTLPASKRNNEIFKYYYQSDLDNGFEANVRVDARIEINYNPFRSGRLQLEAAETKNNQVESYKVTFYGEVTTLKDLFAEDKLADVQELNDELTFEYTGANVQTSITSTADQDVRFPLISSSRVWTYSSGTGINDSTTYAIDYTELFPAVKVSKVFDAIASKYGITFQGNFLTDNRFTKLFTWWKNTEEPSFTLASAPVQFPNDLTNLDSNGNTIPLPRPVGTSQINIVHNPNYPQWGARHKVRLYCVPSNPAVQYYVDVYKNGTQVASHTITGTGFAGGVYCVDVLNSTGIQDVYTFRFRADAAITIDGNINYRLEHYTTTGIDYPIDITETLSTATLSSTNIDFASTAPDIKVSEYFSGVLRMFNLTCYPVGNSTFEIEPLEAWYSSGRDIDITEYTDVKSITYERVKLHKRIKFAYQKSEAFLNDNFRSLFSRDWGSLNNDFNYDGSELVVEPPFENLLFTNLDEARFQVAYSRSKNPPDSEPYTPKPVMLYLYNSAQTCDFYFDNGTTTPQITSYVPFGQDVIYNGVTHSMNFGEEISSLLLEPIPNSLYSSFYQTYLTNLFNPKNRKVSCTTRLPQRLLESIDLNDTLIIRDKKYIINDFKANLTSGQVDLVLLQDFTVDRTEIPPIVPPKVPPTATGPVVVPIRPPKGKGVVIRTGSSTFTTPSVTLPEVYDADDGDGTIEFTLTTNSGPERTDFYYYDVYNDPKASTTLDYTKTIIIVQGSGESYILLEDGGYLLQENLDKVIKE